eukprot:577378-Amphidinium_carterae.1
MASTVTFHFVPLEPICLACLTFRVHSVSGLKSSETNNCCYNMGSNARLRAAVVIAMRSL